MKKRHKNNKKNSHSMNQTEEKKVQQEELNEQATEETVAGENLTDKEATEETEKKELTPEEQMQQQLIACEEKIAAQQDQILRQAAEFDNYRKRTLKEKAELIKNGGEKTISAILPIIDDLERALQNMKSDNEEICALKDGVELIYNKFLKTLQQEGLNKIETQEADFNTDFHEAIALVPAPTDELKGKILDCVQTGYQLNDKVIRHAKVVVGQ
ncbi:MAG: nucleotide exchange factor GrpE [Bacteroidaceae bacterium]|nr:nucleotide exchange factor GrpE [Bacteroidaceae bacterium]